MTLEPEFKLGSDIVRLIRINVFHVHWQHVLCLYIYVY